MPYAKLSSNLPESSLWSEELHVRVVFISFLAMKDENGFVKGSRTGLQRRCNVTKTQFDEAIKILSSPDPESQDKEFDGCRIDEVDGGYVVLGHEKHLLPEDVKKASKKEYMKKYMKKRRSEDVNTNKS